MSFRWHDNLPHPTHTQFRYRVIPFCSHLQPRASCALGSNTEAEATRSSEDRKSKGEGCRTRSHLFGEKIARRWVQKACSALRDELEICKLRPARVNSQEHCKERSELEEVASRQQGHSAAGMPKQASSCQRLIFAWGRSGAAAKRKPARNRKARTLAMSEEVRVYSLKCDLSE